MQAESWRALEDLYEQGVIKALGVSNFDSNELKQLVQSARIKPMVVQNKFDVYHVGKQLDNKGDNLVEYARSEHIIGMSMQYIMHCIMHCCVTYVRFCATVVAYSPFSAYPFVMEPTYDPIVSYVAARHIDPTTNTPATPAQILLKWTLQKVSSLQSSTELPLHSSFSPCGRRERLSSLAHRVLIVSRRTSKPSPSHRWRCQRCSCWTPSSSSCPALSRVPFSSSSVCKERSYGQGERTSG